MYRFVAACSLSMVMVLPTDCEGDSPWRASVGRITGDRDADLIDALIVAGRFSDAETLCRSQLSNHVLQDETRAKWTIRLSQVLTARQLNEGNLGISAVAEAKQPVEDLLRSYPDHPRRWFLQSQSLEVEREATRLAVLTAAIAPAGGQESDAALVRLLQTSTAAQRLAQRVGDERVNLESERNSSQLALIADLVRLQQELQVKLVSVALMQTELFPSGSEDTIAAATKAEQAADVALTRLPTASSARREVERLKVEAILSAGQPRRAKVEFDRLVQAIGNLLPASVQALQIRIELANGQVEQAENHLAAYFGTLPDQAPKSIEMDLAKLRFLLQTNRSEEVGRWLEVIERRSGAYAQRRGEAISLAYVRSMSNAPSVDPSLIAAQGRDWLRRGDPQRAAKLLNAAAEVDTNADRAIQYACEAAAAWVAANRPLEAAKVLADVSTAKPTGSNAPAAHLQSAVLIASSGDSDAIDQLQERLRTQWKLWPVSESAIAARKWLMKILKSQRKYLEAAEVATELTVDGLSENDLTGAVESWRIAFRSSHEDSIDDVRGRFIAAFRPLLQDKAARAHYRAAAATILDREELRNLPKSETSGQPFVDALIAFRQNGVATEVIRMPPSELVEEARLRLMRDGRQYPQLSKPIAELLDDWPTATESTLDRAERLLWKDETDKAIELLNQWTAQSANQGQAIKNVAELLSSSQRFEARTAAVGFWDRLALGTSQGSPKWHEAKLAAIELLAQLGNREEARRRAKYILLTSTKLSERLTLRYESFAR